MGGEVMILLQIAIVEDNPEDARQLISLLQQYGQERHCAFRITRFSDGMSFLDEYQGKWDIVMMDVEMPHMDGMSAAKRLRQVDERVCLIFITNLAQYAITGYEVNAMDYLLKPLAYFPFSRRLDRAIHNCRLWKERSIGVETQSGLVRLPLGEIWYVESEKHYLIFHTQSGDVRSRNTLRMLQKELPEESFQRAHASYLVNLAHVERIERQQVLVHGTWLPVSRSCAKSLMDAFTRYLGREQG